MLRQTFCFCLESSRKDAKTARALWSARNSMTKKTDLVSQPRYFLGRRGTCGWPVMFALLFFSGLAGCQSVAADNSDLGEDGVSPTGIADVEAAGGPSENERASQKLNRISNRLAEANGTEPVSVRLLNISVANAALGSDGNIYLTRKLLRLTSDESEIAAVIAHEMAHKLAGHAEARANASTLAAVSSDDIARMLPDSDSVKALLKERGERVAALARQQELEADAMAISMLAKAGYDPTAVARFMKVMQANDDAQPPGRPVYTSYHPASDIRIEKAESLAAGF